MEFVIRGRNIDVSDGLRTAAQEKVGRLARHLEGWDSAEIHFMEERNPRISDKEVCEVTLRGHGHVLRAKAASADAFASVDRVVGKLEHQLEKLKSRQLQRSHHRRHSVNSADRAPDEPDDDRDAAGRIVKTKRFDIKPMTPEEAALQMELLNHGFYFFTNADTGAAAVVYRRADGDVGLIDAS
ncbi:MAG: ribosome-associated translation inhibitor RaiA [Actinomycetota bacterium]|nr:ribosome-associated translation inhibitor RaiA [Actinomycetota bacterium]